MDVKSEPGVPDGGGVAKKQKTGAPEEAEVLGEGPGVVWQISKVKVGAQKRREKRRGKEERQEKRDRDRERERERERRRKEKSHLLFQYYRPSASKPGRQVFFEANGDPKVKIDS